MGRARKAPKLAPEPERLIRVERSSGGAQRAHMAIMAGKVTPWVGEDTRTQTHTIYDENAVPEILIAS